MARTIEIKVGLNTKQADAELAGFQRRFKSAIDPAASSMNSLKSAASATAIALGAFAAAGTGALGIIRQLAEPAIRAAIAIDRQVNSLKALTGSAEAATRRFQELFRIAQATPGLTTSLAATLDAQLRIFSVAEGTINKLLPVIGRLNAISPLGDPRQFVNNLTQLITQNFERQDLKELVGQSPIAGLLIKQIFNVDNPTNAESIRASAKKLSITSVERLAEEFIKAGETNSALKNATESLGGQFDKLQDRIDVALAPIGEQLLKTILPAIKDLVEILERDAPKITQLLRENKNEVLAVASAFVTMTNAVGGLIGQFRKLDQQFGIIRTLALLAVAITPGGAQSVVPLAKVFDRAAEDRANLAKVLPRGISGDDLRTGLADLILLPKTAPNKGGGAGVGGASDASSAASAAARKQSQAVAEALRDLTRGRQELFDSTLEEITQISKTINEANLDADKRRKADQAFIAKRLIEQREARERLTAQDAENFQRLARREFSRSGRFIEDAINRGQITGGEAELLRQGAAGGFANQLREVLARQQDRGAAQSVIDDLRDEIELMDRLSVSISNSERFMRGFNSQVETVGDAFDRFGANVSRAFTNIRDLFNGLKQAVLGFFNDLLGSALQNLVRSTLGGLFGGAGGGIGAIFRTPSTFPAAIASAVGGGISAPPSISQSGTGGILGRIFGGGGSAGSAAGGAASAVSGGFSISGQQAATALSLGGLQLGVALGGQSTAGKILGGFGGSLGIFSVVGAPLFIAGALLGRGKQRRQDEEAAGQFQRQAYQSIGQLKSGIDADQIDGSQARAIFENQILAQFIQQISGLRTESVRRSRLTNQVADLRRDFENLIGQSIAAQEARKAAGIARQAQLQQNALIHSKLIPEFATGGIVPGRDRGFDSVRAILRPGEMVLTQMQQAAVMRQAGPGVFDRAGVPGVNRSGRFQEGGIAGASQQGGEIVIENLSVSLLMGKDDQTRIVVNGGSTSKGRAVTVNNIKVARTNREL